MLEIRNIPNILTLSRGLMTLIIIGVFYLDLQRKFELILFLFALASITDYFDGMLARKYHVISKFGIVFDSLFDKMLILSMFMLLLPFNIVPGWILVLFLVRELTVDALKNYLLSSGKPVSAKKAGKIKMTVQVGFVITALLNLITNDQIWMQISLALAIVGLAAAYISAWEYFKVWMNEK